MIELEYSTTKDESILNPPQYLKIDKIYNLIIIPHKEEYKEFFDIQPSDSILINGKAHKVAISSGSIELNNQKYFYFYLAPGFKYVYGRSYNITYQNLNINLDIILSSKYSPKILYGLLILPNNFYYLFDKHKNLIVSDGQISFETKIIDIFNKYNFYMAQKNNTIINILDPSNIQTLKTINQDYQDSIFIRPLFNNNFPLGSIRFLVKGVNSMCGISIEGINYNKKLLVESNKSFLIDNLSFGNYTIQLFNKEGPLVVDYVNSVLHNSSNLDIGIDKINTPKNSQQSSLLNFYNRTQPSKNKANLLVNLPVNDSFEIFGPNNFNQQFSSGYQYLQNIAEGYYTIKTKNNQKSLFVVKNDNNYIS